MNMATVEIQNMKSIMQTMAEVAQVMQSMMMSNASAGLVAPGSVLQERPKKWSQRGSLTESMDSKGSGHSPTSHKPKRVCKRGQPNQCLAQA